MIDIDGTITITVPKRFVLSLNQALTGHRTATARKRDQAIRKGKHDDLVEKTADRAAESAQLVEIIQEQIGELVVEVKTIARSDRPTRKERGKLWQQSKN